MIETEFFILDSAQFQEYSQLADEAGVSLDYYLSEFCDVEGPDIMVDNR
jgi:hypothetical protein